MFQDDTLKNHLETSFTIKSQSAVIAEWNMNIPGNILKLGNYRYREDSTQYSALPNTFDTSDSGNFYTGATNSDISTEFGYEEDGVTPLVFTFNKDKEKIYYSLEDCIKPFRPRSGINKASYFNGKFLSNSNQDMYRRPRYYMPHRDDEFKYWRSYRTETSTVDGVTKTLEYGISKNPVNGIYKIDDAVPFVVYKDFVPANRIIVKVQTNIGDIDLGPFRTGAYSSESDPLYGDNNKTTPVVFSIEYLATDEKWNTAAYFDSNSTRSDGSPIFGPDGYLELDYGLAVPDKYTNNFLLVGTITDVGFLPEAPDTGNSFLLKQSEQDLGILYIYNGEEYETYTPEYKWSVFDDGVVASKQFVTDFTNPSGFTVAGNPGVKYREFEWIKGIRVVVKTMNKSNTPFELIEISPRLEADISGFVNSFDFNKALSDLSSTAIPVGQLIASSGNLSLFDTDESFNPNNVWDGSSGSILANYLDNNIKFKFYEVIENVGDTTYFVPLKTLYSEGFPKIDQSTGEISITLRDFYFYFESIKAPQILLTEVSLSNAIAILLDSIGFSNYIFRRLDTDIDPVIPFFFIAPEQNVAEVLDQLAVSTQTAMFFDEYNNFVAMSKEYLLDDTGARSVDITLYGSQNPQDDGINQNTYPEKLSNIINIASQDQKVFNSGVINYTTRYIQRSYGTLKQSQSLDNEKTWIYKPVLLWEVSGTEATKSLNGEKQQKYVLGAMPLNTDLSSAVPTVASGQLKNNTIDFGENIYYITRFQGYFYANSEIIRYDAVEHVVTGVGKVWISNNLEYQNYFSKLPFNGKIYPTGLVRIYSKPYYETIGTVTKLKNGPVVEHGRGQFNTPIINHSAGLDSYWTSNDNVQGCLMYSSYLYSTSDLTLPAVTSGAAGVLTAKARQSQRNSIIKNFLSSAYQTEATVGGLKTTQSGTVQSSALVFNGPTFSTAENPRDTVSYVYKKLDGAYKHIGTRMRIIGKIEAASERDQSPSGAMSYYNLPGVSGSQTITIGGGSGGISIVNPATNVGYYFEIAALTSTNLDTYTESSDSIHNVLFYKVQKHSSLAVGVPIKMWGGVANILVDDGNFTGQYRFVGDENPTVYDLAIEYVDVNERTRVFYLYINQKLVNIITDTEPLALSDTSIGLFVRGTSKAMFENVYGLSKNYADNSVFDINAPIASIFDEDSNINATEALSKYAVSGMIQKTYLSGIKPSGVKSYNMYYEEFGTVMREAAYFNIKYDRAYPALYAKIAPTFNRIKGYSVSGFTATSYGAEFLIFNNTDTLLNLDETTGNYLRIVGVAFTQDTTQSLTVDDYFKKKGNLSDPEISGQTVVTSPYRILEDYNTIKTSRLKYGKSEFTIESPYIQDQDTAESMLGWIIGKSLRPRKSVGIKIFPIPTLQLGDLVTINYKTNNQNDAIVSDSSRFVVYNIEYSKNVDGPEMNVYLSEV